MSTAPRYPLLWTTWGNCSWCGMPTPSPYLIMTRKHGWQCLPNPVHGRSCFDGNFDRDDIYFVYPDNEGVRDTASPLTQINSEGVTAADNYELYTLWDRADRETQYDVFFGVGADGVIMFSPASLDNLPSGGIVLNNGWTVYIQQGFMQWSRDIEVIGAGSWQGAGDLAVIDGFLQYTPYIPESISS